MNRIITSEELTEHRRRLAADHNKEIYMGIYTGDWTFSDYQAAVAKALADGRDSVILCTEHCSFRSDELLKEWTEKDGYSATIRMEDVIIRFH